MSEPDCVFCNIVGGEINAEVAADEDETLAYRDTNGRAPVRILIVPKQRIESMAQIGELHVSAAKRLFEVSNEIAPKPGAEKNGYAGRVNNGPEARRKVPHLRLRVLGGERIGMP